MPGHKTLLEKRKIAIALQQGKTKDWCQKEFNASKGCVRRISQEFKKYCALNSEELAKDPKRKEIKKVKFDGLDEKILEFITY